MYEDTQTLYASSRVRRMLSHERRPGWAILAATVLLTLAAQSEVNATQPNLRLTQLDAAITSISLPLPGSPDTGPISVTLCEACYAPMGFMDCSSADGDIYWPVSIDFPLLDGLGRPPIETTMAGSWITDPDDCSRIFAFDMGYIDDPDLGTAFLCNNNKNQKNIVVCLSCGGSTLFDGAFFDISQDDFEAIEQPWLRSAMDRATQLLTDLQPGVPSLSPAVLDTVFAMYSADPTTEIILYFPESGEFRAGQLTGTDAFLLSTEGIPTVSEWGLIVLTLLGMTAGAIILLGRRRRVVKS